MRVIVSGLIAQHPELGGITWHYLQYMLGFRDLGHEVYYLEDSGEWPYTWDASGSGDGWTKASPKPNILYLASVMERLGFADRWAYRCGLDRAWYGMNDIARTALVDTAELLVNVSGSLESPSEYGSVDRRVYIDTDPVFTQLGLALDERRHGLISDHDVHFTFATNLSAVPNGGFTWIPTRQPIALQEWQAGCDPDNRRYTTIMNWTSYEPVRWNGEVYGQKDMEFERFLDLPGCVPSITLEIALPDLRHQSWEQGPNLDANGTVKDMLARRGWRPVNALTVAEGFARYRDYIKSSRAEWTVAKNAYVRSRCGWFSERSACFLAASRPVVAQDTGFSSWLPVGEGLLAFTTLEEAVSAIEAVEARYVYHAEAAMAIARDYFSATAVLQDLIEVTAARRR